MEQPAPAKSRATGPLTMHESPSPANPPAHPNLWLRLAVITLITALAFWLALNPQWVAAADHWGYVGAFLISLVASATIVLPAPGLVVILAMSAALNPLLLALVAAIGGALGELTGYFAGVSGRALVEENEPENNKWLRRVRRWTEQYGAWTLFVFAAFPLPLFDVAGMVAGALRMRVATFLLAVTAGKCVKYGVILLLGARSLEWIRGLL